MATKFSFDDRIARSIPAPRLRFSPTVVKYDFAVAYPDPDSIPFKGLTEAVERAMKEQGRELALYHHAQGYPKLRQFIVEKLERQRGMKVDPDQVVVTGGSLPVIAMFTQLLTDPGDTIITEEFAYTVALMTMQRFGANVVGVKMDDEGMRADVLDQTIRDLHRQGKRPKFIYTIPMFQNPVGTDMGAKRRQDILAVAQRHGVPIYEDDCYMDTRIEGVSPPAIYAYDDTQMVMYSGSFSKLIAPGIRLGWLVAPKDLIPRINMLHIGPPASHFAGLAVLYYLKEHGEEHAAEIHSVQKAKRDTMLAAVGEHFGTAVETSRPRGGLYLWCRFKNDKVNLVPVLDKARAKGVAFGSGPTHSPSGAGQNYFRLCFGYHTLQDTRDGIALLGRVFEEEGLLA